MPLESLESGQLNIKDLTLEQENKPKDVKKMNEIIERLKEHNLWHHEGHEFWYVDEPDDIYTGHQLLATWIKSLSDSSSAHEDYQWLRGNNYDFDKGEWNYCGLVDFKDEKIDEEYRNMADARYSGEQLLDVIIMSFFDKRQAHKHLLELQDSKFYDKNLGQFIQSVDHDNKIKHSFRKSETQILEIIAEAIFDKERARNKYERLKNSAFYNKNTDTWVDYLEENQTPSTFPFQLTEPRLLDVLAMSFFDKNTAREKFIEMKESDAYDKENEKWWRYSDDDPAYKYPDLDLQMYGALCEYYTSGDLNRQIEPEPVPEQRSY